MLIYQRLPEGVITDEAIAEIAERAVTVYPLYLLQYVRQLLAYGYKADHKQITAETVAKTPVGALYKHILETHGITLRALQARTGYHSMVISRILAGTTDAGYAYDKPDREKEVIGALQQMVAEGAVGDTRTPAQKATDRRRK
jgi:hypothetical protein